MNNRNPVNARAEQVAKDIAEEAVEEWLVPLVNQNELSALARRHVEDALEGERIRFRQLFRKLIFRR